MSATAIVFSIFYMLGGNSVAYVPDSQQTATRYENAQSCKDALRDLRSNLSAQISSNEANKSISPQDRTQMDMAIQRANSMTCEEIEVELPPAKQAPKVTAVPAKSSTLVMWKIGRIDEANIFHGTAYNEYAFDDEQSCYDSYQATQGTVFNRSVSDGATNVQASAMLSDWLGKYKCATVALKASEINRQPMEAPVAQAVAQTTPTGYTDQAPVRQYQQPVVRQQYQPQLQQYQAQQYAQPAIQQPYQQPVYEQPIQQAPVIQYQQPQYQQQPAYPQAQELQLQPQMQYQSPMRQQAGYAPQPFVQQAYPVRPLFIAELVRNAWGTSQQFVYPTPYGSVAECWTAVDRLFGGQQSERRSAAQCVYAPRGQLNS